jgi:serine/threonine protein kinase
VRGSPAADAQALKGLGGYHLVCDARNVSAVAGLRQRKHRDEKPFAIMVADLAAVGALCEVHPGEKRLLTSAGVRSSCYASVLPRRSPRASPRATPASEQARGEPTDLRTDLFSLGSALYTLCAGRPPFEAETTAEVLNRVRQDALQPPKAAAMDSLLTVTATHTANRRHIALAAG